MALGSIDFNLNTKLPEVVGKTEGIPFILCLGNILAKVLLLGEMPSFRPTLIL